MEIKEKSVLDAWKKSLSYVMDNGDDFVDKDGRTCREILNLIVIIESPEKDYEKPIDMMQQFEWVYPSKEELETIMLSKEQPASYEFSYGPRIFNFKGKDQINDFIIPLLKKDPSSRRAMITLFDPSIDSNLLSKNIPSLTYIYFKIKENKLNITCGIRSNDLFIGWPGNIYQITILQKHVAELLGLSLGSLTMISGSAHIFQENFEMISGFIKK